jgi:hypothetical protein
MPYVAVNASNAILTPKAQRVKKLPSQMASKRLPE